MILDNSKIPYLYDEVMNFTFGVDSSKHPNLIPDGFVSFAVNTTFRGGKPRTRPPFVEFVFPQQENLDIFQYEKHQGEAVYQNLESDKGYLISVRGGYVLKIDLETKQIDILNQNDRNEQTRRHYFCQADKYMIIQNGVDIPLIYDGNTIRRSHCFENNPGITNTNISHSLGVATVTTATPHGLTAGDYVAISGTVDPTGYIGNYQVKQIVDATNYKIKVTTTLASPATNPGKTFKPMEVPIGLYMEYNMGRLVVVRPDRREMRIGDLIRTTPDTMTTESVLWFTEELYLAESYRFTLPASQGRIRSVTSIPFMSSATGQGDLLVSGDKGLSTLSLAYPRVEWFSRPIQKVAMVGVSVASQIGQIGYNGDVIFRDVEYGVRTFRLADAQFSKNPAQTPVSSEMNRIFKMDASDKLQFTSMSVFDNRLLVTVTPVFEQRAIPIESISVAGNTATIDYKNQATHEVGDIVKLTNTTAGVEEYFTVTAINSNTSVDIDVTDKQITNQGSGGFLQSPKSGVEYYHRGLAVLDYTSLSGAQGQIQPAWDGLWTGLNTQTITKAFVNGGPRCLVSVYNDTLHRNELWEIMKDDSPGYDVSEFGQRKPKCSIELASMSCKKPFDTKRINKLSIMLNDIIGNLVGEIYYRTDGDTCWTAWAQSTSQEHQFDICATATLSKLDETNPTIDDVALQLPQKRNIILGAPYRTCDIQTSSDARLFNELQIRIDWDGIMTIDKIQLMAIEQLQNVRGGCR